MMENLPHSYVLLLGIKILYIYSAGAFILAIDLNYLNKEISSVRYVFYFQAVLYRDQVSLCLFW